VACLHHLVQVLRFPFEELFAQICRAHCAAAPAIHTKQAA
jgi:hypothetical protein